MKLFIDDEQIIGNWEVVCENVIARDNMSSVRVARILPPDHYILKVDGMPDRKFKNGAFGIYYVALSNEIDC